MKSWLRLHRYLGAFSAPMLILFAISGSWQLVNAHKSKKDGSYTAPAALHAVSDVHMGEDLEGPAKWAFRAVAWLVATSLVVTSLIGLAVAFRTERSRPLFWLLLASGTFLPVALYLVARK